MSDWHHTQFRKAVENIPIRGVILSMMSIQKKLSSPSKKNNVLFWTLLSVCVVFSGVNSAHSRKPADVFSQRIILSAKSFPSSFKSDRAFLKYMKRAHLKKVVYPKSNRLTLRFMAFFSRPIRTTEFTALVYDLTDRNRLVATISSSRDVTGCAAELIQ